MSEIVEARAALDRLTQAVLDSTAEDAHDAVREDADLVRRVVDRAELLAQGRDRL